VAGIQFGPEASEQIDKAVSGLAFDLGLDPSDYLRRLELLACLAGTIEFEIAAIVGGIPTEKRDWERIALALGRGSSDESVLWCRSDIEASIETFENFR
jgi:hypothetical protein